MAERFPSHSELYRDFHKISQDVLSQLSAPCECEADNYTFEEDGWDIVFDGGERQVYDSEKAHDYIYVHTGVYIEYKSSIEEWGKQFDAYVRQLKPRMKHFNPNYQSAFLISFDERFEDYKEAARRCDFEIVVLPKNILDKIEMDLEKK